MRILERIPVPTGDILIVEGDRGELEMLSIGDYGKEVNLKADCLGLTEDPGRVVHQRMLPLEEKWVITISTQYGCSMGCNFCDVPKVGPGVNATVNDLFNQVCMGIDLHPEVKTTKRLNLHYARMGEPTFNSNVITATYRLKSLMDIMRFGFHPVVSTMMPIRNKNLFNFLQAWMHIKNHLMNGNAGLQLSINSTNEDERAEMFNGSSMTLNAMYQYIRYLPAPVGRKITLNFAVADYDINPSVLLQYFNPKHYIIKLTPMHKTCSCLDHGVKTSGDYTTYAPYEHYEEKLKAAGYDVLVFIASREEDEGRITCGNALLSGTRPFDLGV